jgi:tetratricopeptide (TPR) repeat protein
MSRVDTLRAFIASKPHDPFPKYALALEYKNAGQLAEAREQFDVLLRDHGDYVASYLHAGNTHLALGDRAAARAVFARGIEVATRRGDAHARGELEGAFATLGDG